MHTGAEHEALARDALAKRASAEAEPAVDALPKQLRPIQAALDSVKERVPDAVYVGLSAVILTAARDVQTLATFAADTLAVWKAWPGRGEGYGEAAMDAMVAVHEALFRARFISPGDVTPAGDALLAAELTPAAQIITDNPDLARTAVDAGALDFVPHVPTEPAPAALSLVEARRQLAELGEGSLLLQLPRDQIAAYVDTLTKLPENPLYSRRRAAVIAVYRAHLAWLDANVAKGRPDLNEPDVPMVPLSPEKVATFQAMAEAMFPEVDENGLPRLTEKQADRFVEIIAKPGMLLEEIREVPLVPPPEVEIEEAVGDLPRVVCGKPFTKSIGEVELSFACEKDADHAPPCDILPGGDEIAVSASGEVCDCGDPLCPVAAGWLEKHGP